LKYRNNVLQSHPDEKIKLSGAAGHNLKNVDLTIPLGIMTCVTGFQVQVNQPN
jgi:excinuclease UvrABC ATPase subunit